MALADAVPDCAVCKGQNQVFLSHLSRPFATNLFCLDILHSWHWACVQFLHALCVSRTQNRRADL